MSKITIIVDNQSSLEVDYFIAEQEGSGELEVVLPFDSAYSVIEQWRYLSGSRRGFRFGGHDGDDTPDTIIIAWSTLQGLTMTDLDPFYGRVPGGFVDTFNAYSLQDLAGALPIEALQWGPLIGEADPIHPGESRSESPSTDSRAGSGEW